MKTFLSSALRTGLLMSVLVVAASAGPLGTASLDGGLLYATGGEVTIYFWNSSASFDSCLWLDLGSGNAGGGGVFGPLFPNHGTSSGARISLGVIPANTPLPFRLQVTTRPFDWYLGPAESNSDGEIHARISLWAKDEIIPQDGYLVSYEDWPGQSDFDYNDFEFVASGVRPTPLPEPATFVLLGSALIAAGIVRFRPKL